MQFGPRSKEAPTCRARNGPFLCVLFQMVSQFELVTKFGLAAIPAAIDILFFCCDIRVAVDMPVKLLDI